MTDPVEDLHGMPVHPFELLWCRPAPIRKLRHAKQVQPLRMNKIKEIKNAYLKNRVLQWLIISYKTPLQNGHWPREHALHWLFSQGLCIFDHGHSHWTCTLNISVQNGRLYTTWTIGLKKIKTRKTISFFHLDPSIRCHQKAQHVLGKEFHHVIAFKFPMDKHIQVWS